MGTTGRLMFPSVVERGPRNLEMSSSETVGSRLRYSEGQTFELRGKPGERLKDGLTIKDGLTTRVDHRVNIFTLQFRKKRCNKSKS